MDAGMAAGFEKRREHTANNCCRTAPPLYSLVAGLPLAATGTFSPRRSNDVIRSGRDVEAHQLAQGRERCFNYECGRHPDSIKLVR